MMEIPEIVLGDDDMERLSEEGQVEFRGLVCKTGWLARCSRPDIVFDHVTLSICTGQAWVGDMKQAMKVMRKLKGEMMEMKITALGKIDDLKIEGWGDAGYKSLPDKVSNCGGQVIMSKDMRKDVSVVISWGRRKLKRIGNSLIVTEVLSLSDTMGEDIFMRA